ncbi:cilia- and flagella-associated protein 298 [Sabethes cyaneus]|uniref:cilia- and flagella-associated protein 298 n=1 Tax=Sabethes cyaneus TaxID=53552 RepID=UPI00237EAA39|nr:cilia- and flagella-associated protein 298 [Sabethes cyaneus]
MVLLHVKRGDVSQFLYEGSVNTSVEEISREIVTIYNGQLKVSRVCSEIEELSKHGTMLPPEMLGLTEEQVKELQLVDDWGEKCVPSGGWSNSPDPVGRRNGRSPQSKMQEILLKTVNEARLAVSNKLVLEGKTLQHRNIQDALDLLRGAVMIVYPMELPPHDPIRMEFANIEDLTGTQASLEVIEPAKAQLWFAGKLMLTDRKLGDIVGTNEKTKIIIKLAKIEEGAPGREPVVSEEARKQLMLQAYRRQEELKVSNKRPQYDSKSLFYSSVYPIWRKYGTCWLKCHIISINRDDS